MYNHHWTLRGQEESGREIAIAPLINRGQTRLTALVLLFACLAACHSWAGTEGVTPQTAIDATHAVPASDAGAGYVPVGMVAGPNAARLLTDAAGSDLWPATWDDAGDLVVAYGDGSGFEGGPYSSYGISRLAGTPASYTATDLMYGPVGRGHGKISDIVSVGGVYYMFMNSQDANTPPTHDLYKSTTHGTSISVVSGTSTPLADLPGVVMWAFVQQGQDYASHIDGYLYMVGSKNILVRAPLASIDTFSTWQVFSGSVDGPAWSSTWADAVTGIGRYDSVLIPSLGVFVAVSGGMFSGNIVFEWAPKPWGPWTTFATFPTTPWQGQVEDVSLWIAPKWTGNGPDLWLIFSGVGRWDRFNAIKLTMKYGPLSE